jgi:polysaccharide deacetylase family protein (PEP-CTERM system associated)
MKRGLLTFDVETWFSVTDFAGCIDPDVRRSLPLRLERPINFLLDTLDEHQVKSTFFFVGAIAGQATGLVKRIADRGHEIACHSYSHRLLHDLADNELETEIIDTKHLLEDISGSKVLGFRAPTFSLTRKAIDYLVKGGYAYDSSLWAGKDDLVPDLASADIVEFPVSTRRFLGKLVPMGGGYMRLVGVGFYNPSFRSGPEPLVLYLHPWEFDPCHPRVRTASPWVRFKHYNGLRHTGAMLTSLLFKARWGSCSNYLEDIQDA